VKKGGREEGREKMGMELAERWWWYSGLKKRVGR
jgi:hypothetical protein